MSFLRTRGPWPLALAALLGASLGMAGCLFQTSGLGLDGADAGAGPSDVTRPDRSLDVPSDTPAGPPDGARPDIAADPGPPPVADAGPDRGTDVTSDVAVDRVAPPDADAGGADAGPDGNADAGGPDAAGSCRDRYGAAVSFVLCETTATSCTFSAFRAGASCDLTCGVFGGTCLGAARHPSGAGQECRVNGTDTCQDLRASGICICSLD